MPMSAKDKLPYLECFPNSSPVSTPCSFPLYPCKHLLLFFSCASVMQVPQSYGNEFIAISCINVGVGPGGTTSMLAKVALIDYKGHVMLDHFVRPTPGVVLADCRTASTGVTVEDLYSESSLGFNEVQIKVGKILQGKVLVGYCIWNDLSVLGMSHPAVNTRDVGLYQPFRNALRSPNSIIRLPTLAWTLLHRRCSEGLLNPVCTLNFCFPEAISTYTCPD